MSGARGLRATRRREELRVEAARALRRAIHETAIDQLDLADAAGVDASIISRMMSTKCGNTVTIVDLVMWLADDETRPVALRLVQYLATQSRLDVREIGVARTASPQALVHEACDVIRVATEAMADGQIDPAEARSILTEIREFEQVAEGVKAKCHDVLAVEKERIRGLS